ncbi:MAG: YeeE/YedE family protein [Nitrospiraceae bacterium]|nr:MAG: YeeE/YedE family protein [Nitrospiraceae bacterium]
MDAEKDKGWNPYLAGALTGLVIILSAWSAGQYFGSSTCFVRTAGMIEQLFSAERVAGMDYFIRFVPQIDWQLMFVTGILIGAFISAITSGSFRITSVPDMWQSRFGPGALKRGVVAFTGGVILMVGARLAGGCPSGYGLSALVQLAVSGLVVLVCFFAGGIVVAKILYREDKRR